MALMQVLSRRNDPKPLYCVPRKSKHENWHGYVKSWQFSWIFHQNSEWKYKKIGPEHSTTQAGFAGDSTTQLSSLVYHIFVLFYWPQMQIQIQINTRNCFETTQKGQLTSCNNQASAWEVKDVSPEWTCWVWNTH